MPTTNLLINGEMHQVDSNPEMPLLWVLRDTLGLTGTKYGCGQGLCGSCTVHLDGVAVRSCVTPVSAAASKIITTIEGLSSAGGYRLQRAWLAEKVPQCGYCQPGQLMAAAALLSSNPLPNDAEIDAALSGILCRCGTYQRIRSAIHRAASGGGGV
jgi:isoquinoline 1-oxidoreductase alpha subunit